MESQLSAVKNLFALCDEEGNVGKRDYDTFLANVVKRLREYMERERIKNFDGIENEKEKEKS